VPNEKENLTVADLLARLGFAPPGADLDETLRWALIELILRRENPETPEES